MNSPREEVLKILAEIAGVEASTLRPETHLAGELGLDSPKALRLLCRIEETLDFEIPEEAPPRFETVSDLMAFVEKMAASRSSA